MDKYPLFQVAPNLGKYPIKLFNNKTCGEIFDLVVSKKIVPESVAKEIEAAIMADPDVQKYLDGKTPKKVIVVPKKIVNVVL